MDKLTYYGFGKLLITGEYLVLDEALSLAVPTKCGQRMEVVRGSDLTDTKLIWKSYDNAGALWFSCRFDSQFNVIESSDKQVSDRLKQVLNATKSLNPDFLSDDSGYEVSNFLEFDRNWGLGTSSTLIHNLFLWAKVNPYELLKLTFGGSGYDLACAGAEKPLLFQLKQGRAEVESICWNPPFVDELFLVYLNQKQNSQREVSSYHQLEFDRKATAEVISEITQRLVRAECLTKFETLLDAHETILSKVLQRPTIKSSLFKDYPGTVKSLGAWGGDFVLATRKEALTYFKSKGYDSVFPFCDLVKI
jgi:mevalonate kinase